MNDFRLWVFAFLFLLTPLVAYIIGTFAPFPYFIIVMPLSGIGYILVLLGITAYIENKIDKEKWEQWKKERGIDG